MEMTLKVLGGLLIVAGLITGFVIYDSDLADQYDRYKNMSSIYEDELAVLEPLQADNVTNTVLIIGSGVICGLFFLALGYILEELARGREQSEAMVRQLKNFERLYHKVNHEKL